MLNNQGFNQQRSFLSQSKIFSDHKSYSNQNMSRNDKQIMYSSGIFLKNSGIMSNRPYQNYQTSNIPLSPHKGGFINKNTNVQFMNTIYTQQNYQYKTAPILQYNNSNLNNINNLNQPLSPHFNTNMNSNFNNNNNLNMNNNMNNNNNLNMNNNNMINTSMNNINTINPLNNNNTSLNTINNMNTNMNTMNTNIGTINNNISTISNSNSNILNNNTNGTNNVNINKDSLILYDKQMQQMQQKIQILYKIVLENQKLNKQKISSRQNSSTTLDQQEINSNNNNNINNNNNQIINNHSNILNNNNNNDKKHKQDTSKQVNNNNYEQLQNHKLIFIQQNSKIWKKIHKFEQLFNQINIQTINKKIQQLQQSFQLSTNFQIQKSSGVSLDDHIFTRIKFIQKSIRQMGQDIHLINDKQENFQMKFQNQFTQILKKYHHIEEQTKRLSIIQRTSNIERLSNIQKNSIQTNNNINKKFSQISNDINIVKKQLKCMQQNYQQKVLVLTKQLQSKIKKANNNNINWLSQQITRSSSTPKYPYQPIVLKYLQKFKVVSVDSLSLNNIKTNSNNEQTQQIRINELTYYIDHQGYVLDNDRYYLIDETKDNQRIKLNKKHIQILKQNRILI